MTDALKLHILNRAVRLLTLPDVATRLRTSEETVRGWLGRQTQMPQQSFLALVDIMRVIDK